MESLHYHIPWGNFHKKWVLWVAYVLSFIVCTLFQYRKKIILGNLKYAFPDVSSAKINHYYRTFCTQFMLTQLFRFHHIKLENIVFNTQYTQIKPKNMCVVAGHIGEFEIVSILISSWLHQMGYLPILIYKAIKPKWLNKHVFTLRNKQLNKVSNNTTLLIESKFLFRTLRTLQKKSQPFGNLLLADQWPGYTNPSVKKVHLFHRETWMNNTPYKLARKLNIPVYYCHIQQPDFFSWDLHFIPLNPAQPYAEQYTHYLEEDLKKNPSVWLWSHKRWKKRKDEPI